MPMPMWASNNTNVARTNAIVKTLANMFKDKTNVVPTIAPLNESGLFTFRPGYVADCPIDQQDSIQVFYQLRSSTGMTPTATSDSPSALQKQATPSR
jgi:hypothetical protein